jgi:hypothetical protein
MDSVKNYFEQQLLPQITQITGLDEILVVIGGSVSYGFNDEYSDVDVYLLWELPREVWFAKLRQYLFQHKIIDGYRVQFIPLALENSVYSPLAYMLHEEYKNLKNCDAELLFDIQHYLPIHDPKNIIYKSKAYVNSLGNEFWQEKCIEHSCKYIDTMEAFYSSLKRGNIITGSMYFGDALKGLLQIAYLCSGNPFPTAKWIWNGLERVDNEVFKAINQIFKSGFPRTCEDLESYIRSITVVITDKL